MLLVRLAPIIFVIIFHWSRQSSLPARYERIENCTTSGKLMKIYQCEVKDHKIYFNATFNKPVDKITVEVSLFRKVSNFFRPMFPLPKIKWCEFINNKATKMSPVLSMITVSLKPHAPQFFEACPFTGDVYVNGLSTPTSVNTWLPKGNYKFTVHIYNNEDSLIIGAAIIMIRDN